MARTLIARNNIKVAVGSYLGNGTANTNIDIGFSPQFLILKRMGGAANAQMVHADMSYGNSGFFTSTAEATGHVLNVSPTGFVLNSGASVNPSGTRVNYFALRGKPEALAVGSYYGNLTDNRNVTDSQKINFTPNFVFVKNGSNVSSMIKTLGLHGTGDLCGSWDSLTESADRIQNLQANGFQIGLSSGVNTNAQIYRYLAMKTTSEFYAETSYTGNGTTNTFTLPFLPDFMILKGVSGTASAGFWFKATPGNTYTANAASDLTDAVTGYSQDPINSSQYIFTVGANTRVNENAVVIRVYAFLAGDFIVPFTRTLV